MDIIAQGNGEVISQGEAECNLAISECNYIQNCTNNLLIIYFIKCSLIFQDSNMRSGNMTAFLGSYSGHLDYVHNCMTTFVRAFNVSAV